MHQQGIYFCLTEVEVYSVTPQPICMKKLKKKKFKSILRERGRLNFSLNSGCVINAQKKRKKTFLTSLHRGRSAEVRAKSSHSRRRLRCVGPRSIVVSCQRRSDAEQSRAVQRRAEERRGGLTCALRCCLSAEARLPANRHTAGDGVRSGARFYSQSSSVIARPKG